MLGIFQAISPYPLDKPLIALANQDRDAKGTLMFAILAFSVKDAHVVKFFTDQDYFRSIDEISGNIIELYSHGKNVLFKTPTFQIMQIMCNEFGVEATCPLLIFFQVDKSSIIDFIPIKILGNNAAEVYNNTKIYIEKTVAALDKYNPESKHNYNEIFDLVKASIDSIKAGKLLQLGSKNIITKLFEHIFSI